MTLEKAMELQKEAIASLKKHKFYDHADAVTIGMEAIKREKGNRDNPDYVFVGLLPGETKD